MKRSFTTVPARQGAVITVLAAVLALPLMAMLAYSIDVGYMLKVEQECQNVADAASLAGVAALDQYATFSNISITSSSSSSDKTNCSNIQNEAISAARAQAKSFVVANTAGGVSLTIDETVDVLVGYWNKSAKTFTQTSPPDSHWPNAVKVIIRRDDTSTKSNGSLPLFFGPVLGVSTVPVTASSIAMGNPTSPSVSGLGGSQTSYAMTNANRVGGLLPFAVDVDSWQYYLLHGNAGPGDSTRDNYGIPTGLGSADAVTTGDGIPEFQVYPPPSLIHASQKGLLSFQPDKFGGNGNSISGWIDPGPTPQELLDNFGSSGFQPPVQLYGTPGNKTGHFDDLTGEIRLLPLIDYSRTTTGNHGQYYIVSVVPVVIVYGPDNTAIWAQPWSGPLPSAMSGTAPTSSYTYTDSVTTQTVTVPAFGSGIQTSNYKQYMLVK